MRNMKNGEWEGFYTYQMGMNGSKHQMKLSLSFNNGIISGSGFDDVGAFKWTGSYTKEACLISKNYQRHQVEYIGEIDENGIWGIWTQPWRKGGFHIWPKEGDSKREESLEEQERVTIKNIKS